MDTTDTFGEFPHCSLCVSSVVNPLFSSCRRIFRYIGLEAKASSLLWTDCEKIGDKSADVDHHAVPPPEYQAGGDSKREDLCQQGSGRVTRATPAGSSSGQVEAAGVPSSGGPVATEKDSSSEKKVHLHPNTDGEKYIRKFDDPAKKFKPQSEEEHEFYNQVLDRKCARFGKYPTNLQDFSAQRCDLEPIYERLVSQEQKF